MAKERMFSTSVQLSGTQFDRLDSIKELKDIDSNAEVIREAFDFYVEKKFPELLKEV